MVCHSRRQQPYWPQQHAASLHRCYAARPLPDENARARRSGGSSEDLSFADALSSTNKLPAPLYIVAFGYFFGLLFLIYAPLLVCFFLFRSLTLVFAPPPHRQVFPIIPPPCPIRASSLLCTAALQPISPTPPLYIKHRRRDDKTSLINFEDFTICKISPLCRIRPTRCYCDRHWRCSCCQLHLLPSRRSAADFATRRDALHARSL
jgi:hypothetical protein